MRLFRIFTTGLFISFLGTLPLGTLNVSAMQISLSDGLRPAFYFVAGALLVEIFYVRLSLVAMNRVMKNRRAFRILEWMSILIIIALAVSSFVAATDPAVKKNVLLSGTIHRFWLGALMSAANPVQVPFWFGWSTVLFTKNVLEHRNSHYNTYMAGIGLGTFAGNLVFIFGGRLIVDKLNANQQMMHWVIGGIFAITAFIMGWKLLKSGSTDPGRRD